MPFHIHVGAELVLELLNRFRAAFILVTDQDDLLRFGFKETAGDIESAIEQVALAEKGTTMHMFRVPAYPIP